MLLRKISKQGKYNKKKSFKYFKRKKKINLLKTTQYQRAILYINI